MIIILIYAITGADPRLFPGGVHHLQESSLRITRVCGGVPQGTHLRPDIFVDFE